MTYRESVLMLGVIAACLAAPCAAAQTPERLVRQASRMGDDGGLVVSPAATVGSLAVDQYLSLGRKFVPLNMDKKVLASALDGPICRGGIGQATAVNLRDAIAGLGKADRALLKARNAESLSAVSISVLAALDGVDAAAIRADEAIGPGVYHDAINGLGLAMDLCGFFGLERTL